MLFGGFPIAGALIGWLLTPLASWLVTLPWAPLQGPAELLESLPQPQVTIGAIVVGIIAGAVLGAVGLHEALTIDISSGRVVLTRGGDVQRIDGSHVAVAFLTGKHLVLLDSATRELARAKTDLKAGDLEPAFRAHGYSWAADDPHRDDYERWVEDLPDLPIGADALFKARQRALDSGDGDDAEELRAELAKLGIVVRDVNKRQYWRLVRDTSG
ncbi:hypothetical protein EF847_05075 [Actinobacteria bacterium YIM 96077]|uniref:DUF308 domain-containing protein n=1 Tax=Phytoactinopolyspora halophila TaxID=1981511 RepID=A0A329R2Q0_9ACTN|nr:hypothetical protein EF847_05075 [Actinobacteria bacterium YIM 96077]RAW18935.1 hypothetical protein DPM12_00440 [Phytoactinopolyspora halophila]